MTSLFKKVGRRYLPATAAECVKEAKKHYTSNGHSIISPTESVEALKNVIGYDQVENFAVLYLDNKHRVVGHDLLSEGIEDQTAVYPRRIARAALLNYAVAVIVAHNHPAGDPNPSTSDIKITAKIKTALDTVGVRLLDHVIFSGERRYCFSEFMPDIFC